jgi:hypothetical protein
MYTTLRLGDGSMTVTAHFNGTVFVPDEPVDLPVGRRVRVILEPITGPGPPLSGLLAALQQLPENPDWPADGAAQHDHYLYGTPKAP